MSTDQPDRSGDCWEVWEMCDRQAVLRTFHDWLPTGFIKSMSSIDGRPVNVSVLIGEFAIEITPEQVKRREPFKL